MSTRINWMRSKECGYSPGHLVADFPGNRSLSLSRRGRRWVLTVISKQSRTAEWSEIYPTKREAMAAAQERYDGAFRAVANWEQLRHAAEIARREDEEYYLAQVREAR